MKKTLIYLLASLVVLMFIVPASAQVEVSGNVMVGLESMDYGTATLPSDKESDELQFSNIKLNLDVKADVCEGVTAVAQLRSTCEECNVEKRCVYLEICDLLIPDACIQIGRIQLPLGLELARASEGANTMDNPLIFNSLLADTMDTICVDDGLLISKTLGAVDCKLGITNGHDSDSMKYGLQPGCLDKNSDKAITLNIAGDCAAVPGLKCGVTYYTNDAADENEETDEIDGWILDVGYEAGLLKLAASMANFEDKEGTAKTVETVEFDFLTFEVVYGNEETPWWVAARHSTEEITESPGPDDPDDEKRLELGIGYKLCEDAYLKVEYIDHEVDDNVDDLNDYDGIKAIVNVRF
jgi:predicted porin